MRGGDLLAFAAGAGVQAVALDTSVDAGWAAAELQPRLYDLAVTRFGGSYSAEHGIGPHNQAFYDLYTPGLVKEVCRLLKARLDPAGILGTVRLG